MTLGGGAKGTEAQEHVFNRRRGGGKIWTMTPG